MFSFLTSHPVQRPLLALKTRLLSATALPSTNFNKLLKTISNESTLREQDKPSFRDYWQNVAENFPHTKTLYSEANPETFAQFIKNNKEESSTVRGFYRREVIFNKESLPKIQSLVGQHISNDALTFCIRDSFSTKDTLIAADIFLLYHELYKTEPLRHDLASEILSAIAFHNPKHDHLHLLKYLQIMKLFQNRGEVLKLTTFQTSALCNKALTLETAPILTKQVLNELLHRSLCSDTITRAKSITAAYDLIHIDFKSRNASGVFSTWINISDYYSSLSDHDPRILYMVMKSCLNNKVYKQACKDMLSRLSPQFYSNDALVLPTIIDYVTKRGDLTLAKSVMDNVNDHILPHNTQNVLFSKRFLSSVLKMHLNFNDTEGVDRVLKQIHDTFGSYSQENFQAITSHMLKVKSLDNIVKAVNMVSTIPQKRALLAYGSIIDALVEWQIASNGTFDKKSMPLIDELLIKAHKQDPGHKSTLWTILASLYIKKLVHYKNFRKPKNSDIDTTNLDLAKLIFLKSDGCASLCDYNPFNHSSPQDIVLRLTNKNKIIILKNIAINAVKGHRKDIFLWCCAELYHMGVSKKELMLDWHMIFSYYFRSMNDTNKKKLEKDFATDGLGFISNALK